MTLLSFQVQPAFVLFSDHLRPQRRHLPTGAVPGLRREPALIDSFFLTEFQALHDNEVIG